MNDGEKHDRYQMTIQDIFADLPSLVTERLILRRMSMDDAAAMFENSSDPEMTRYVGWDAHKSIEDSRTFLATVIGQYHSGHVASWGIEHRAEKRLIGTCGFVYWNIAHARAEIGYAVARKYWNSGYTTEAVREVFRFGFQRMELNRIEARCEVENLASARVMEKSGMSFEGILRQHMLVKGSFRDLKMYSILRDEWTPPPIT